MHGTIPFFFCFMFLLTFFINRFTCINVTRHKYFNKCSCSRQQFTESFKLRNLGSFAVSQIPPLWGSKVYLQSVKETFKTSYVWYPKGIKLSDIQVFAVNRLKVNKLNNIIRRLFNIKVWKNYHNLTSVSKHALFSDNQNLPVIYLHLILYKPFVLYHCIHAWIQKGGSVQISLNYILNYHKNMHRNFLDPHMVYFQFFNTILNRKHPSHYHVIFCRNLKTYANYAVISCILIRHQFSSMY